MISIFKENEENVVCLRAKIWSINCVMTGVCYVATTHASVALFIAFRCHLYKNESYIIFQISGVFISHLILNNYRFGGSDFGFNKV